MEGVGGLEERKAAVVEGLSVELALVFELVGQGLPGEVEGLALEVLATSPVLILFPLASLNTM